MDGWICLCPPTIKTSILICAMIHETGVNDYDSPPKYLYLTRFSLVCHICSRGTDVTGCLTKHDSW